MICPSCGRENPDGFQFCGFCAAPLTASAPAREQRKTVTVLFCDVSGSTELGERLDPEALRALLARYFEQMKAIVERHGGTVEKFIGDAVMAVFGVPVVHEDDALRAVRAAAEMRDALPELGIRGRIGITTGEVVTGTEERLATGDAVNIAARLEQAAEPGEILIGEGTYRLARDVVDAELLEPLELKGKAEPVAAYRVTDVRAGGPARRAAAPMVGRERELDRLHDAFDQALRDRSCQLFTVLGVAGVGKSRLVAELLDSLVDARVVAGRCLPYGEGITYWPVVEVLKQLPETDADGADTVRALAEGEQLVSSSEEIAWAFRKLLEAVAAVEPLVCVFDDIHWGEDTFLDLLEHVADLSRGAPILLLCMARPDLLDRRPAWAGGKLNATNVLLEPLGNEEAAQLIERLGVSGDAQVRMLEAAEGNPFFLEEMVALVQESDDGDVAVPPTIQALLAARLDQLDPSERGVLERGAVEGRVFHRGAVQALAEQEAPVTGELTRLVRKELVRPDTAQLPGEDAFRFRHLLIRDAAYDGLPKATRIELHQRFAGWLEAHGGTLVELDEIVGYHLEQACRYRDELGLPVDEGVAARARRRLRDAGDRAALRQDVGAATNLLERAVALLPKGDPDVALRIDLVQAFSHAGRIREALSAVAGARARAADAGDGLGELCCRIEEALLRIQSDPEGVADELASLAAEAIPVFEAARYGPGLSAAYFAAAEADHMRARFDSALATLERGLRHASVEERPRWELRIAPWIAAALYHGTTPAPAILTWFDRNEAMVARHRFMEAFRAMALAMVGRIDEGRSLLAATRAELADRGLLPQVALTTGMDTVELEYIAGDMEAAVRYGREGVELFEQLGELSWLSTAAGLLACSLVYAGRIDEAERWVERAIETGASDDAATNMLWRQASGLIHSQRGDAAEAIRLAREAVAIGDGADMLNAQARAYRDLGDVLELAGRPEQARAAREHALARFERKGNLPMAEAVRARLV